MSDIAAVILAAGSSHRLGRPKQTLELGGETLIRRSVRVAIEAEFSPVIVVVRPGASFAAELQEMQCIVVANEEAEEGMASSIRCGVRVAKGLRANGIVVMTCDQVALQPEHLRTLIAQPERVAGSRYLGRVGIPAYFPAAAFEVLMELKGDVGAREILQQAVAIENEYLALDVDTEGDLQSAREHLRLS